MLPAAQGGAAEEIAGSLQRVGDRHPARGGPDPGQRAPDLLRRGLRPGEDQPDRRLVRRRDGRVHRPARHSRQPSRRGGISVHRLRSVHTEAGTGIRSAKRPLGRPRQDRMRVARLMTSTVTDTQFDTLAALESEAIHIFREVAGEFERPVILFSGGKDSTVLLHLALKAFWPAPLPFSLLHVDTGHNLDEVLAFRDHVVEKYGLRLHVASVEEYLADGRLTERPDGIRNPLQTVPLL